MTASATTTTAATDVEKTTQALGNSASAFDIGTVPYDNPRQWKAAKKTIHAIVFAMMTLALTYSSSAYTSSTQHLMHYFDVSREVILLGVALFVLGFAASPLLLGPLAQLYGHKPVYVATFVCFAGMSFGVSEAPNIGALLAFRFLAGVFGSSSLNNVPASIGSMNVPGQGDVYMLAFGLSAFGGPGLGPLLGAFIDTRAGWRWNMRVQAIFIAITALACILLTSETNHEVLKK